MRSIHDASARGPLPLGLRPPTAPADDDTPVQTRSAPQASSWLLFALAGLVFLVAMGIGVVGTAMAIISRFEQAATPEGPALAGSDVLGEGPAPVMLVPEPGPTPSAEPAVAATPEPPAPRLPAVVLPPPDPTVKILTSPPTASLSVDGVDQGRTPAKIVLKPGHHAVAVTSGDATSTFEIDVRSGSENKWCFHFASGRAVEGSCP